MSGKTKRRATPRPLPPTERRAVPLKQFCRSIGVSYDAGRRAMGNGLKTIRFGALILVPIDEVERVMREGLGSASIPHEI